MRYLGIATLALMLSTYATAGEPGKKCTKPVQECLNLMVKELKSTGFIGVELDKNKEGRLVVTHVIEGTPAEKAQMHEGDELVAINGIKFDEKNEKSISAVKKPGAEVVITIKRGGQDQEMKMTLVPMPADAMARYIGEHMMQHAQTEDAKAAGK